MEKALWMGFVASARRFPDRPALSTQSGTLSYGELREAACRVAATLQRGGAVLADSMTAVLADRGATAFTGILGALLAGDGYVPLNPSAPPDRTRAMFQRAKCRAVIVDREGLQRLDALLVGAAPTLVLAPETAEVDDLRDRWPNHTIYGAGDLEPALHWREPPVCADAVAYLLFTSGSTGQPKGVMVAHRNVTAFVDYMVQLYEVNECDRFSQTFQLTFDLSVFDMFVCWERGAHLCCPSPKALLKPGRFIRDMGLTIWFSVPSVLTFMKQFGMLKAGSYPSLRLSLFCGEPLPVGSVQSWRGAAPNSVIENLYGPTELTIACTRHRWDDIASPPAAEIGIVPIGEAYPGMRTLVVDDALNEVAPGGLGELLMAGPQMSLGYLDDPVRTAAAFLIPPGQSEVFYRTGDRVRRPLDDQPMTHFGRLDFQVKVMGHRVELGEIEAAVRDACGSDGVVAVGWPRTDSGYGGVEAFIECDDAHDLRGPLGDRLPDYMMPRRIHVMPRLPRNTSGKFDRQALTKLLEEGL